VARLGRGEGCRGRARERGRVLWQGSGEAKGAFAVLGRREGCRGKARERGRVPWQG